jgi:Sulfotransferase family
VLQTRPPEVMGAILIFERHKLLVALNPKVMTTTLKTAASILKAGREHAGAAFVQDRRFYLQYQSQEEQLEKLATYKRALLVRNPYTRLHSAWNNKFRTLNVSDTASAAPWIPMAKQVTSICCALCA